MHHFGYFGVFLALFLEAIGIPFPSETILIGSGIEMSRGVFQLVPLWACAAFGNILGSNIAYLIGRFLGRKAILKYGRLVKLTEDRLSSIELKFQKYQALFLLVGKFIAFVRIAIPYIAGINEVRFGVFTAYNTVAAIVWSFLLIYLGRSIQTIWKHYSHFLIAHWYITAPALIVVVAIVWWLHKKTKQV